MFVGVVGSESPMSKSFYDDSWKGSYDLQSNGELVSEMNWPEIVKGIADQDIVIRIRLKNKEHLSGPQPETGSETGSEPEPEPEPEVVQPQTYVPSTQLAPPAPSVLLPSTSRPPAPGQMSPGQRNGVQSARYALPAITYEQPENHLVHKHGLNPYLYSLAASYIPQPLNPQLSFSYPQSAYMQLPYGDGYPHTTTYQYGLADTPSAKPIDSLTRVTPFRRTRPYTYYRGDSHYTPMLKGTKALTSQLAHNVPSRLAGR